MEPDDLFLFRIHTTLSRSHERTDDQQRGRLHSLYREMLRIRRFEQRLEELVSQGKIGGTTHLCIGQEAVPEIGHMGSNGITGGSIPFERCCTQTCVLALGKDARCRRRIDLRNWSAGTLGDY